MDYLANDWVHNNPCPLINMAGKKINMLTVLHRAESVKGRTMWHCRCDCGKELDVWACQLRKGQYSCGCAKNKRISEKLTKHGKTNTKLFGIWTHMLERCYKQYHKSYKDYGGRGISVCNEWKNNFMNFYNWAMENGFDETADFMQCTLDRIDVNGNYEPNNCRFVSMKEQCNNRRNSRFLEYSGEAHTVSQWAELIGISYSALEKRLELGWTIGQALGFEYRKGVRVKTRYSNYDEYRLSEVANA